MIIAGGQIFKIAASRFVNVSEEEINLMKENAIPRNTKHDLSLITFISIYFICDITTIVTSTSFFSTDTKDTEKRL